MYGALAVKLGPLEYSGLTTESNGLQRHVDAVRFLFRTADKAIGMHERRSSDSANFLQFCILQTHPLLGYVIPLLKRAGSSRHHPPLVAATIARVYHIENILSFLDPLFRIAREQELLPRHELIENHEASTGSINSPHDATERLCFGLSAVDHIGEDLSGQFNRGQESLVLEAVVLIPVRLIRTDDTAQRHDRARIVYPRHCAIINSVDSLDETLVDQFPNELGVSHCAADPHSEISPDQAAGAIRNTILTAPIPTLLMVIILTVANVVHNAIRRRIDIIHPISAIDTELFLSSHLRDNGGGHYLIGMEGAGMGKQISLKHTGCCSYLSSNHNVPPMYGYLTLDIISISTLEIQI